MEYIRIEKKKKRKEDDDDDDAAVVVVVSNQPNENINAPPSQDKRKPIYYRE